MRLWITILLIIIIIQMAGCYSIIQENTNLNVTEGNPITLGQQNSNGLQDSIKISDIDLEKNRKLWKEKGITNYKIEVDSLVPGMKLIARPVLIKVQDGKAILITPIRKNDDGSVREYENIGTIDKIFEIIQRGLDKGAIVKVKYNSKYGYPEDIFIDYGTEKAKGGFDSYSKTKINRFEIVE